MANAWTFEGAPSPLGYGTVTLVEGSAFCVCAPSGDIAPGAAQGLFFDDTRLLSRWELRVDDDAVEPLSVLPAEPFRTTFLGRARPRPGQVESTLFVERERYVGAGMREDVTLRNMGREPVGCTVTLAVESDFGDLFEVKAGHVSSRGEHEVEAHGSELRLGVRYRDARSRGVRIAATGALAMPNLLAFRVMVPPRGTWSTTVQIHPVKDGVEPPTRYPTGRPLEQAAPVRRLRAWNRGSPTVSTRHPGLALALQRSREDLGALRIFDPARPEHPPAVAAGAPWFMTVFGRDSLLVSWMALPLDQSLALGTLRTLARLQGRQVDPLTEEEPGRILHELRFGMETDASGEEAYYGSVDATPLFVMLLGELRRWGLHRDEVERLLPHADRALAWIENYGDLDGDGFVEYRRKTDRGLVNQGWKDSLDGINFADGRPAEPPIALAEVQGYVYAAYVARAHFAREAGEAAAAREWSARAAALQRAFNERFWLPDRGWFAVGLDADKRPIDALASNMGHCLWTGIVDVDKAAQVAERLVSPEMFTGWGVRTLSSAMGAYNPVSYHNGSVWPHDNALLAGGLMRYGFVEHAQRLAAGLLDAAVAFGGRLPELFCGFSRADYASPIPYPTSCSPQAWAAASPVHMLRVLLRLDPWMPYGKLWLAPVLPKGFGDIKVRGLPLADARLSVGVRRGELQVTGLPDWVELVREPRPPLTAADPPPPLTATSVPRVPPVRSPEL